jgi:hypothetical protein
MNKELKPIQEAYNLMLESSFAAANKIEHPVEKQWHHSILSKHGFEPDEDSKVKTGLVRSYSYTHPKTGDKIKVATGANADYWDDKKNNKHGYWRELESHAKSLVAAHEGK